MGGWAFTYSLTPQCKTYIKDMSLFYNEQQMDIAELRKRYVILEI